MKLEDYLSNHTIVKIGTCLPGYVCCETIVDDPIKLISVLGENSCYIAEIRWWDRVEISTGSSIGYGGPRDSRSPNTHFFAETDISKIFNVFTRKEEYYSYLDEIKRNYSNYDLYPSFDVKQI